jgi:hypothetical protein
MNRITPVIALLAASAATSYGQSVNIDFSSVQGAYPTGTFSAAGVKGYWNDINNVTPATVNLAKVSAPAPTGITLTWDKSISITNINDSNTTGNAQALLDDGQFRTSPGTLSYSIKHLEAGTYAVFTYAGKPSSTNTAWVSVAGSTSQNQLVGGNLNNDLMIGVSHAVSIVTIPADGTINITVGDSANGQASCSGIQLKKLDDSGRLRFYVVKNQNNYDQDGNAWETAYEDLNPLLKQLAYVGGANCEVWVKSAFYYPTTGADRSASFVIPSGLHLYGGFNGTEDTLAERTAPAFFITAMSGAIGGGTVNDNSYHVVNASGASNTTVIDGFTISSGRATGGGNDGRGAGMLAVDSRVNVRNTKFISNYAEVAGGGVFSTAYPDFDNCLFYNNATGGSGAGVYHHTLGALNIANSSFLGNESLDSGGAITVSFADATLFGVFFSGNSSVSGNGGSLHIGGDSTDNATLTNCTLSRNSAGGTAGGVYASANTKIDLRNSILWGNLSPNGTVIQDQYSSHPNGTVAYVASSIEGISANPLFVDADGPDNVVGNTDDNCRLQDISPCLDTGDNAQLPWDFGDVDGDGWTLEYFPFDLDGGFRIVDHPNGWNWGTATVDRGAYELQFNLCPADFDLSGFVDLDDYTAFVAAFEAGTDNADFDKTGFVDTDDFTAFVEAFESGC